MYVGFDLESTGLDTSKDRICEIAAIVYDSDFKPTGERICTLVNPGTLMEQEVIDIHGITNDMVKDYPTFDAIAADVQRLLENNVIIGQNVGVFDLPLVHFELVRHGQAGLTPSHPIVDTLSIERQIVKNTLSEMHKRYCGYEIVGAHRADIDVEATVRVLEAQVKMHGLDASESALTELCAPKGKTFVDFSRKLQIDENGQVCYAFGKFSGQPVLHSKETIGYARWIIGAEFPADTKETLKSLLNLARPAV